jgi:hypothetical protein
LTYKGIVDIFIIDLRGYKKTSEVIHPLLTLKLKLTPDVEIAKAIDTTLESYKSSYNRILAYQWPKINEKINGVELHHATYYSEKEYGLPTALICSARVRATESLKSVQTAKKNYEKKLTKYQKELATPRKTKKKKKTFKYKTFHQPEAKKHIPIRYNNTCMIVQLTKGWVSFATVNGRKKLKFNIPEYYKNRIHLDVKSTELYKSKNGKYFLNVCVEYKDTPFEANGKLVGGRFRY